MIHMYLADTFIRIIVTLVSVIDMQENGDTPSWVGPLVGPIGFESHSRRQQKNSVFVKC